MQAAGLDRPPTNRWRIVACLAVVALTLFASPSRATAQESTGTIAGRVVDAASRGALAGVAVQVEGTSLGAVTGDDGQYRVSGVPAGARVVNVRRIGYTFERRPVTVAAGATATLDVSLQASTVSLDQVVITGTAGAAPRRSIANTVTTVDAAAEVQKSAVPDFSNLLRGRASSVAMTGQTGRIGGGPTINIRGQSSMGLGNSPLIYVDGVRVDNRTNIAPQSSAGASNLSQGAAVGSTLNDINPADIESIEIIKGPAAATIYGTEAANGVIQIVTKKGAASTPAWRSNVLVGGIKFRDAADRIGSNYALDANGNVVEWNGVRAAADSGKPLFTTGMERHYDTAISGVTGQTKYYASLGYQNDFGVEPNNSQRQFTSHLNASVPLSASTNVVASMNYVARSAHLGAEAGFSGMTAALWGHPILWPGAAGGFYSNIPAAWAQSFDNAVGTNRFTGSATINNQPLQWLTQRLIVGLDNTSADLRAIMRYASTDLQPFLSPARITGGIGQTLDRRTLYTLDYSGTGRVDVTSALTSATSVGVQYTKNEIYSTFAGGSGFAAPGLESISATATRDPVTQNETINTTIGSYVQEQFSWRNRLFVTGAVRVDNNSAFGQDLKWVTYPNVGASWVVSEEPFWRWGSAINTLRLRSAYGASGRQPLAFSALRTYASVVGPGGANGVTPDNLGNPALRPERSTEAEYGVDVGLFNRVNVELTYYRKRTRDQIVNQPVAPSTGFASSQVTNLGTVRSRGIELQATFDAITRERFGWSINGNVATANNEIETNITNAITTAGRYDIVGYPIQGQWARRIISADRGANGQATNVLCEGASGAGVPCASAPFKYLGSSTPTVFGAVGNTITLGKSLRLFAMTDFKRGFKVYNSDAGIRCAGVFARSLCRINYYPDQYPILDVAAAQSAQRVAQATDRYFENAAFVKLRELSASYTIPSRLTRVLSSSPATITLAGRELYTWTKYSGTDPEAITGSAQAIVPPLTRFSIAFTFTR